VAGVNDVDPLTARDSAEFVQVMRRLVVAAGRPSVRELSRRADALKKGSLPHSTLADTLRKENLPAWRIVDSLVRVCGVAPGLQGRWRSSWERLAAQADDAVIEEGIVPEKHEDSQTGTSPENRRSRIPIRSDQSDDAAHEFISWLKRTLIRPNVYKGEARTAIVEISNLSAVDPYEARQFSGLRPGDSIRFWLNHPLLEHKTLFYGFASGESADRLITADLPQLFKAKIKCLGQIRIIESAWIPMDDEERGIGYDTAYSVELIP
jgi:hypothetical protein